MKLLGVEYQEFVKLVCGRYREDPTIPSVVTAWLPDDGIWYMSVVRYGKKFAEGDREVVCRARAEDLAVCFAKLVFEFLKHVDGEADL